MIQTVLTFDKRDEAQIWSAVKKLLVNERHLNDDGITIVEHGALQLETAIHQLKDKLPGVKFDVSKPEVVFQQPTVFVEVEGPSHLYQYVVKELNKRLPDKEGILVSIKSNRIKVSGRFPLLTIQDLVQCFRNVNAHKKLQTHMQDFRDKSITESKLREMLNTFVSG
ncbi:hypothetical protein LCGC14_0140590 [marine sediment metagenome]|uniref:Uncharacterized protein n=1 Tax=marine sediment metagenome TaxID=412755 RepID=A0A0F9Y2E4_9ZZZZ